MILIFEQDTRTHPGVGRFAWKPSRFTGKWDKGRTWRVSWGLWSISYYPSPGLRSFFDRVESGETEWRPGARKSSPTDYADAQLA